MIKYKKLFYFFLLLSINLFSQITDAEMDASEDMMQTFIAGGTDASWVGLASCLGDVPKNPFQYQGFSVDLEKSASEKGWGFKNDNNMNNGNYDHILFLSSPKTGSDATLTLYQFKNPYNSLWWKGISLKENTAFDNNLGLNLVDLENNTHKVSCKITDIEDKEGYLLLSKAKQFGKHDGVYLISNSSNIINQNDLDWHIVWVRD